jgi:Cys-rich repeat protein
MPFTKPKFRSGRPKVRGVGPDLGCVLVAFLAVFGCGRETMDLAVSRAGSAADGGVDGGLRDGGAGSATSIACSPDGGCAFGVCVPETGRCGECTSSTEATRCRYALSKRCDTTTNECVECLGDADCPAGEGVRCNTALRGCTVECGPGADCPDLSELPQLKSVPRGLALFHGFDICDPNRMFCVQCIADADCTGQPRRSGVELTCFDGACIECKTSEDCRGRPCRFGVCF